MLGENLVAFRDGHGRPGAWAVAEGADPPGVVRGAADDLVTTTAGNHLLTTAPPP